MIFRRLTIFALFALVLTSCNPFEQTQATGNTNSESQPLEDPSIAVDVAIAELDQLIPAREYIGTTAPIQEVSIRAQVEGQLQRLSVDIGDRVKKGQILARLDDEILQGALNQAKAEKAAQYSAIISAQSQVGDAQIKVQQAQLELQQAQADILRLQTSLAARIEEARLEAEQAQADAERLQQLAEEGATAGQQAEQALTRAKQTQQILRSEQASAEQQISQAKTTAQTAAKLLRSAQAQVKIEQQQVAAAKAQADAQGALINQAKARQSYAVLRSPIDGKVLERSSDPGNLVQPGTELLKLGDFSRIKVRVEVSELQVSQIRPGQTVSVKLDAFNDERFSGSVTRISPSADPTTSLVPIEITLNHSGENIASGLLARVQFLSNQVDRVIIPQSALNQNSTVFVVQEKVGETLAIARKVETARQLNGKVEILSGLAPGEKYIVRSRKPLQNKNPIRLSALSQTEISRD